MIVADGGGDGREQRAILQVAASLATADPPAASRCSVGGDGTRLVRGAVREEGENTAGHLLHQFLVLRDAKPGGARPRLRPVIRIEGALGFGLLDRWSLHQDALPLVAPARAAETHHRRRLAAVLRGAARQR